MRTLIILLLVGIVGTALGQENTWASAIYVDDSATGANSGTSWTDAYAHLQDALVDAGDRLVPVTIQVAKGIYKPDRSTANPDGTGDRHATFQLINGVVLLGGYAGVGEPDPNARDILVHETVLSGDLLGDDLNNEPGLADNSWHVVTGSQTNATAVLDGFRITGGNADGNDPDHAGGGLHVVWGDPTVNHCTFDGNRAGWTGGGAYCQDSGAVFADCMFVQNAAAHGAGLFYSRARDAVVTDCLFLQNESVYEGGGLSLDTGQAEVSACTFQENTASWNGGAISVHPASEGNHVVTQCEFIANRALGRGVSMGGGAIADRGNGTTVSHCVFQANRSLGDPADQSGLGGALHCDGADTNVINCTFAGNFARAGSAMACSAYHLSGAAIVSNCILWDGGDEVWIERHSSVMVSYSDIQSAGGTVEPGVGNINTDPNFALPGHWVCLENPNVAVCPDDPSAVWVTGDYHLMSQAGRWDPAGQTWIADECASPCIDAGDPDSPWQNEPEPNGERVNIGAHGGTTQASMTWGGCTLTVSSDSNGSVITPGEGAFTYDNATSVTVEAVADENWYFSGWTGTAVEAGKVADPTAITTTVAIDGEYTLYANFACEEHTLIVSSDENGSVITPGEGTFTYDNATSVTVEAVADEYCYFSGWTGTAVEAGKVADPTAVATTVTIDGEYTLQANFAREQHTLTLSSAVGGSVYLTVIENGTRIMRFGEYTGEFDHGTEVRVVAIAESGNEFANWSGTIWSTASHLVITMDQDHNVTPKFRVSATP